MMSDVLPIDLPMARHFGTREKIAFLEREIRLRRRVYPNRVETGRMRQADADREIAAMEAILADYVALIK
jgi:hypothetical protein